METRMSRLLLCVTAAAALTIGGQALAQQPATGAKSPPAMGQTPPVNPAVSATTPPASTPPAAAPKSPPASAPAASADTASSPASATVSAPLTVGLSVKDNTGAVIGQVTELKADASGKQMATVKMGTDSFAVAASSLSVENGSAVINLSQQQVKAMIKKPAA